MKKLLLSMFIILNINAKSQVITMPNIMDTFLTSNWDTLKCYILYSLPVTMELKITSGYYVWYRQEGLTFTSPYPQPFYLDDKKNKFTAGLVWMHRNY